MAPTDDSSNDQELSGPLLKVPIYLNNFEVEGVIDTGSQLTLMTKDLADELQIQADPYRGPKIMGVTSDSLKPLGQVKMAVGIRLNDRIKIVKAKIVIVNTLPSEIKLLIGQNINTANDSLFGPYGSLITVIQHGELYLNKNSLIGRIS